jgi:hypothetical protein
MTDAPPVKKKSPLIALVLSGIVPGFGQLYTGQPVKGIILLVLYIGVTILGFEPFQIVFQAVTMPETAVQDKEAFIMFFICSMATLVLLLYAMIDAFSRANKINSGS